MIISILYIYEAVSLHDLNTRWKWAAPVAVPGKIQSSQKCFTR